MNTRTPFACAALIAIAVHSLAAEPARVTVDLNRPGVDVPPTLHGLFFEDINYAADGGLYAELIQNRSFEHRMPLFGWRETARAEARGRLELAADAPLNAANPTFLRITLTEPGEGGFGVANQGFDGIAFKAGERCRFSIYARLHEGGDAALDLVLQERDGPPLASARITGLGASWKKFEATLECSAASTN